MDTPRVIEVNCPACGKISAFSAANRWRPFCSERCKRIDLGAWASDQYRIAGAEEPGTGGQDDPPARH